MSATGLMGKVSCTRSSQTITKRRRKKGGLSELGISTKLSLRVMERSGGLTSSKLSPPLYSQVCTYTSGVWLCYSTLSKCTSWLLSNGNIENTRNCIGRGYSDRVGI